MPTRRVTGIIGCVMKLRVSPALLPMVSLACVLASCPGAERRPRGRDVPPTPEELVWAKVLFEQPDGDHGDVALAVDQNGNLSMAGRMWTAAAGSSLFISRTPLAGEAPWSKVAFAEDWGPWVDLALGRDGGLVLAASFLGATRLGSDDVGAIGRWQMLLIRFRAADGMPLWQRTFVLAASRVRPFVAVDSHDRIFVAGHFDGRIDLTTEPLTADPEGDLFAAVFLPDGQQIWAGQLGGPGVQGLAGAAVDGSDRLVLAGWFDGSFDLFGSSLTGPGERSAFTAVLSPEGKPIWSRVLDSEHRAEATGLALAADGDVLVTGTHRGTVSTGARTAPAGGDETRCFVACYAPDGRPRWLRSFGGAGEVACESIAVDRRRGVLVAGRFQSTAMFGATRLRSRGPWSLFAARLDTHTGAPLWALALGDSTPGRARSEDYGTDRLVVLPDGNLLITADFAGGFPTGRGRWYSGGNPFALLIKLRP